MKLNPEQWCKIQDWLANIKCPNCFSAKVKLTQDAKENAKCEDCGCRFEFNPDFAIHWE